MLKEEQLIGQLVESAAIGCNSSSDQFADWHLTARLELNRARERLSGQTRAIDGQWPEQ